MLQKPKWKYYILKEYFILNYLNKFWKYWYLEIQILNILEVPYDEKGRLEEKIEEKQHDNGNLIISFNVQK